MSRPLAKAALVLAVLGLAFHLAATAAIAKTRTLRGTVTYRERMALPPSAVVEVKLVDVSLADAPSRTIAATTIRPRGQVPIPYRLRFDDRKIRPRHSYALEARITVGGELLFVTTTRHTVLAGGRDDTDIVVQRAGGKDDAARPSGPAGHWLVESIRGDAVASRVRTTMEIGKDGSIGGKGGCNGYGGKATVSGERMKFGPLVSTQMACAPAVMRQEGAFHEALREVRRWRLDPTGRKLALLDQAGKPLVVLGRM